MTIQYQFGKYKNTETLNIEANDTQPINVKELASPHIADGYKLAHFVNNVAKCTLKAMFIKK